MSRGKSKGPVITVFPSSLYQAPLGPSRARTARLNRELEKEAGQIHAADDEGRAWSKKNYANGFTSYGSMDQLHVFSSTFEDLRRQLDAHVYRFARALEMDIPVRQLQMSSCWVNIMGKNATHTMHIHPLSVISGTYYVKVPKGASGLKFEDPRMVHFMASPPRKLRASLANQRFVTLTPRSGDVVLFESWMKHEVPPSAVKEERISVSFNYDWV